MTASRFLRAGALALASLACARPQASTGTADSKEPATADVVNLPREEPIAEAIVQAPPQGWGDLEVALAALEPLVPSTLATQPDAWASREASDRATRAWPAAPPRGEETDGRREEERLKSIGAVYRKQLRGLEFRVRFAEQAVQSAAAELSRVQERPKLTMWPRPGPLTLGWCESEDSDEIAPSAPDPVAVIAAAEDRLAQAREELKQARDAEDDLLTKIRRERIPLSYVL